MSWSHTAALGKVGADRGLCYTAQGSRKWGGARWIRPTAARRGQLLLPIPDVRGSRHADADTDTDDLGATTTVSGVYSWGQMADLWRVCTLSWARAANLISSSPQACQTGTVIFPPEG